MSGFADSQKTPTPHGNRDGNGLCNFSTFECLVLKEKIIVIKVSHMLRCTFDIVCPSHYHKVEAVKGRRQH